MDNRNKVVVGCQGGGMHAAFEVGVLKAILEHIRNTPDQKKTEPEFELVGLSGTSAGALCALMVWYGLECLGAADKAICQLEDFWEDFVASTSASTLLNLLTYGAFRAEEIEVPVLGVSPRLFDLNPSGAIYKAVAACLPSLGVRKEYFDLMCLLEKFCPKFSSIDCPKAKTRLLIGATEVVRGYETVFDSAARTEQVDYWHQQLPLTLSGVAASGTLPAFREAQHVEDCGYYWDGLYSQNPPVREFFFAAHGEVPDEVPDELWIVRINPQQWPELPRTIADIQDRENELMGNLSLHKELDFILKVKTWRTRFKKDFAPFGQKDVIVRTIKMRKKTCDELRYSSKFDRSRGFMRRLREEGYEVANEWLDRWHKGTVGSYPKDAA
jgi:NTE family protein